MISRIPRLTDTPASTHRAALVGAFAFLAGVAAVGHEWLLGIERPASDLVRGESLSALFGAITVLGGTEVAVVIASVLALLTWRRCRTFAVVYPTTLVVGALLNIGLKHAIGRPRPSAPDTEVSLASFPSGHTLQATLLLGLVPLAVFLFTQRRWVLRGVLLLSTSTIVAIGLSRVYLGAHWPTDVIGGALLGVVLILIAERVMVHERTHGRCRCALTVGSHRDQGSPRDRRGTAAPEETLDNGHERRYAHS